MGSSSVFRTGFKGDVVWFNGGVFWTICFGFGSGCSFKNVRTIYVTFQELSRSVVGGGGGGGTRKVGGCTVCSCSDRARILRSASGSSSINCVETYLVCDYYALFPHAISAHPNTEPTGNENSRKGSAALLQLALLSQSNPDDFSVTKKKKKKEKRKRKKRDNDEVHVVLCKNVSLCSEFWSCEFWSCNCCVLVQLGNAQRVAGRCDWRWKETGWRWRVTPQ